MSEKGHTEQYKVIFNPGKRKTFQDVQDELATMSPVERHKAIRDIVKKIAVKRETERLRGVLKKRR